MVRTFGFYRFASKPFSEILTINNFGFKDFWTLCLAFIVSEFNFMGPKCAKNWKLAFSKVQCYICFWPKDRPFSKMFSMSDFGFSQFCMLCLAFPKNIFNLFTKKCAKKVKNPFSNAQNICFWLQGNFKTNF